MSAELPKARYIVKCGSWVGERAEEESGPKIVLDNPHGRISLTPHDAWALMEVLKGLYESQEDYEA